MTMVCALGVVAACCLALWLQPASGQYQPILSFSTQLIARDHDGEGDVETHFSASVGTTYGTHITAARLRTLLYCAHLYAATNDDMFPPRASMLFDDAYWIDDGPFDPCVFYSPSDSDPAPTTIDNDVVNGENSAQISFEYLGAGFGPGSGNPPIFRELENAYNGGMGRMTISADGTITFEAASPPIFDDFNLTLDACREGSIHRGPGSPADDYMFYMPPETISEITGKIHSLNFRHEGSISESILDVFDTEGWGTASNDVYFTHRSFTFFPGITVDNFQEQPMPVSFYSKFESVLMLPAAGQQAGGSFLVSGQWHDYGGQYESIRSDSAVAVSEYGVLQIGDAHVVDVRVILPGESDYVPGHRSYRVSGVSLMTLYIPNEIEGYFTWIDGQTIARSVRHGMPAGDILKGNTLIQHASSTSASGPYSEYVLAFVHPSFHWTQGLHEYPGTPIHARPHGDANDSFMVDIDDAEALVAAFTGPNNDDLSNFEALQYFDFDGDGDIDCRDYQLFAYEFPSPPGNLPVIPECEETYSITVHVEGAGNVRVQPHANELVKGEEIWLIAEQWPNRRFVEWQGDLNGSDPAVMVTIDGDVDVTAVFEDACGLNLEMTSGTCTPMDDVNGETVFTAVDSVNGPIRHAESFAFAQELEVVGVRWFGAYSAFIGGDCSNTDQGDHFVINIYDDDNGLPGDLLVSYDDPTMVERSSTGELRRTPPLLKPLVEYRYSCLLGAPFVAEANETYWVEIINDRTHMEDNACLWFWSIADGGDDSSLYDFLNDGYDVDDVQDYDLTLCMMTIDESNQDCNSNGLADACETADGTTPDCNGNLVPDSCEDVTPVITEPPESQSVDEGATVTFSVTAEGEVGSYRWQKNGAYIPGATARTYAIQSVTAQDAGSYRVEVTTACGSRFSEAATLTVRDKQSLTVIIQNSPGCAVTLNPPGGHYNMGQQVTLSAWPAAGWRFDHWEGDASGTSTTTNVTMNGDRTVTAVFARLSYTLNLSIVGDGNVDILAIPAAQDGKYLHGAIVRLTATAAQGSFFSGWSGGGVSGNATPLTLVMTSDRNITATFSEVAAPTYTLTATIVGQGQVQFDRPGGVYDAGQTASIEALPAEGWSFERWTGAIEGTDAQTQIVMNADHVVVAVFREQLPAEDDPGQETPETPSPSETQDPPGQLPNVVEVNMCGECANGAAAGTLSIMLLWIPARFGRRRSRRS